MWPCYNDIGGIDLDEVPSKEHLDKTLELSKIITKTSRKGCIKVSHSNHLVEIGPLFVHAASGHMFSIRISREIRC